MISLIKFIVFLVGLVTISYFVLPYFGYEYNLKYLTESKVECEKKLKECSERFVWQGSQVPECDPAKCVDKNLIIKKK